MALLVLAAIQLVLAGQGLETIRLTGSSVPALATRPKGMESSIRPVVLVAHGFAGSNRLMRGFTLTLAHAGYTVVAFDFAGHGRNPRPLPQGRSDVLLQDAQVVLEEASSRGLGDPSQVALLGHSMGSGVVLQLAQKRPTTQATIAVSPVSVTVTPELPQRLLLMAGQLEGGFVESARTLLAQAGGEQSSVTPRRLVIVPGVEHISILFSPLAHATAREWLDAAFGPQPGARNYVDSRLAWYGLGLLGMILLGSASAPLFQPTNARRWWTVKVPSTWAGTDRSLARRLVALAGGAAAATLLLWLAGKAGLPTRTLMGLQVGGYLLVWFFAAGGFSLLILWLRPPRLNVPDVGGGLLLFLLLWLAVGLLGQSVWLSWLLVPRKVALWVLGSVLLLPWFLAAGQCSAQASWPGRLGWWLAHSLVLSGATFLGLTMTPGLGFLLIVLPLFPLVLALHTLVWLCHRSLWSFAISGAFFVSWLLLSVFPLVTHS
jgi:dienelactone hydrolase